MKDRFERYEGHEKRIDLMLSAPVDGLRGNHNGRWERVVRASLAKIISKVSTRQMDAYLLSESSLFVREDRIVMITCGQTRLIDAIPEIVHVTGRDRIARLFYERKHLSHHGSQASGFKEETAALEAVFPGQYGRLGSNGHDHVHLFHACQGAGSQDLGITFQLLMHDLAPGVIHRFNTASEQKAISTTLLSFARETLPGAIVDSHFFSPAGFSLNGISEGSYFTFHVTPQKDHSYTSFETNRVFSDFSGVIENVLAIFRPGRFSLSFTSKDRPLKLPGAFAADRANRIYRKTSHVRHQFDDGYGTLFVNYTCAGDHADDPT